MESERNEEAGTAETQEEVMDLCITITDEVIKGLLDCHKHNETNAALDIILNGVRETIIEKVKERFNIDLS